MKLHLVRFSQDVDLENMEATENFLVFKREDGSTFRVPVPEETIQELLKNGSADSAKVARKNPDPGDLVEQESTLEDPEETPSWTEFESGEGTAFRGQIQLEEEDYEEAAPRRYAPQTFVEDDEDGVPAL